MFYWKSLLCVFILLSMFGGATAQGNGSGQAAGLSRCSQRTVDAPQRGMLVSDAESVFLGSTNGTLSAYEAKNLAIVWRLELGGEFASEILLVGSGIVVVNNTAAGANGAAESSTIRLIGKDTGVTAWSTKLAFSEKYFLGRLNGGIAAISRQGSVNLLDAASGQVRWQTGPQGTVNTKPAFAAGRVIFGTAEKQIFTVSAGNGEILNKLSLDLQPTALSLSKDGTTLVGDERGHVTLLGAGDNKPVWKFKSGAGVSSAFEIDEGVLLTSLDNFVYLISDYNADVIWKRRLPGRVLEGGLMLNGYLVVLVYGENSGYVLDIENGKVIDVFQSTESDLINRAPVFVRDKTFALTTTSSIETYAVGQCIPK